jgi:hypothetical protein
MNTHTKEDSRRDVRFNLDLPVRFNLNPDYHYVQSIRKMGVVGRTRNISRSGLSIDSQLDLGDVFQIFPEAIEKESPFEMELEIMGSTKKNTRIKGAVRWYRLEERSGHLFYFEAGIYLTDSDSQKIAQNIVRSLQIPRSN